MRRTKTEPQEGEAKCTWPEWPLCILLVRYRDTWEHLEGPGDMTLTGRRRLHESMKHLPHLHERSLDLSLGSATYLRAFCQMRKGRPAAGEGNTACPIHRDKA